MKRASLLFVDDWFSYYLYWGELVQALTLVTLKWEFTLTKLPLYPN